MPSNLRLQLDAQSTQSFYPHTTSPTASPRQSKMSLTQTYRIASTARGKLGMEASRADHDLRLLVGHANLLDSLMVELANAEREQESWFNNTIRAANHSEPAKHIQWFDSIAEEEEIVNDVDSDSDSDSDSEVDINDFPAASLVTRRRSVSPPPQPAFEYEDEDDVVDFEEDDEDLTLTRVPSHTPDLIHEDSDSEDESMPPSPSHSTLEFDAKTQSTITSSELYPKAISHYQGADAVAAVLSGAAPLITAY